MNINNIKKKYIRNWAICNLAIPLLILVKRCVNFMLDLSVEQDTQNFVTLNYNVYMIIIWATISCIALLIIIFKHENKKNVINQGKVEHKSLGIQIDNWIGMIIFIFLIVVVYISNNYLIWTYTYNIFPLFYFIFIFGIIILLCKKSK